MAKIILSKPEAELFFHSAISNGLGYFLSYGFNMTYDEKEYKISREKLEANLDLAVDKKSVELIGVCYEDVIMQMLKDGYKIKFIDIENDGEYSKELDISMIHKRTCKTPMHYLSEMIEECDDADTADAIIQTVLFGEILFS